MALHFTREEFANRQQRTIARLEARQLDGLLMFRQESMYYLSGYDSFGYVYFSSAFILIWTET
jgi:Xaa-Pro dipeptidase